MLPLSMLGMTCVAVLPEPDPPITVVLRLRLVAWASRLRPSVAVIWRFCLVSPSVYGAISRLVDQRADPYSSPSLQLRLMLHR